METVTYIHLKSGDVPPKLEKVEYFKAIVLIEDDVTTEWRSQVSDWLVQHGCRYMMAWGKECGLWDDSVDIASLEVSDFKEGPDEDFVMTTWHEHDQIQDVLWYSNRCAMHPTLELLKTYILHISPVNREKHLLELFQQAIRE